MVLLAAMVPPLVRTLMLVPAIGAPACAGAQVAAPQLLPRRAELAEPLRAPARLAVALPLSAAGTADHDASDDPPPSDPDRTPADDPAAEDRGAAPARGKEGTRSPSLDFDLLGAPSPPPPSVDAGALRLRRKMLTVHQAIGLGLVGLQLSTTVVGQLNYSDRFGGPETSRYKLTHRALAYTTLGVFAVNGLIALLAPSPSKTPRKLDRVMVHRLAMLAATLGMVAQGALGISTRERVGYQDQERLARAHLVVGYATLAAVAVGVGVFLW